MLNPNYRTTQVVSNDWKLPLNLAIGLHVLLILSSIFLPGLFEAKPRFADIYTVSIINVAEPVAEPPPPPTPPKVAQPKPEVKKVAKPAPAQKAVALDNPTPPQEAAPVKAVSLKPLKKKVVKKIEEPKVETPPKETVKPTPKPKPNNDALAKKRRQELADAIREEELLAEKARLAKEAVEMEKQLLAPMQAKSSSTSQVTGPTKVNSTSTKVSSSSDSQIERMYYAAITNRLLQFWALPESMQKQSALMSTAVITINQNGQIANIFFENRSGDTVFDQFVRSTIEAANPMPAIPAAMKKQRVEIGLNFKPGGIQ
ncbi:energy transducer TonB [Desulforhopalus sp. IMCC35007]|uniref:energy transducer TonB n=1 Tax=Desulforhopalus sp. IMCC35007 TaxID=2569543 RepID=UPI0010AE5B29|nr:TonB family protein [Desulforhopalus sp. IMCC35007]TKB10358.1 TonB family protein [Desulforhopalus sp. IMCC35007]